MSTVKTDIMDLPFDELAAWLEARRIESYRAHQIFNWVYKHQADRFDQMTNLNKAIRERLQRHFEIRRLAIQKVEHSRDGTRKYLFGLSDGLAVESVLIPEKQHDTLCISSQVGCAQGCRFCLTGKAGFTRNLTQHEIVSQVRDILYDRNEPSRRTNIVMMGMGEPLANFDRVVGAIRGGAGHRDGHHALLFGHGKSALRLRGGRCRWCRAGGDDELSGQ